MSEAAKQGSGRDGDGDGGAGATSGSRCARCDAEFECGLEAGREGCWCAELPALEPTAAASAGCLCPECLRAEVRRQGLVVPLLASDRSDSKER